MNVNTLNNNNNVYDSVVTPPRVNDLALWYTADYIENTTDNSHLTVSHMYDRSGRGNHLTQATAVNQPFRGVSDSSTLFGGKQVVKFTHIGGPAERDATWIYNFDVDIKNIFGQFSAEVLDPGWGIAMVVGVRNVSTFSAVLDISHDGLSPTYLRVISEPDGGGFMIKGSGDTDADEGDQMFSAEGTMIMGCVSDGSGAMWLNQYLKGVAVDWDDSEIETNYPVDPQRLFVDAIVDNRIHMGKAAGVSPMEAHMEVAECLMWNTALTTAERTETLNYLRDKWDCT